MQTPRSISEFYATKYLSNSIFHFSGNFYLVGALYLNKLMQIKITLHSQFRHACMWVLHHLDRGTRRAGVYSHVSAYVTPRRMPFLIIQTTLLHLIKGTGPRTTSCTNPPVQILSELEKKNRGVVMKKYITVKFCKGMDKCS